MSRGTPVPEGTVYIVDDDEAVRDSLEAVLGIKGVKVRTYASAESFLADYRPESRGCALVDLRMPGMDGLTLVGKLKAQRARLPVVIITGHGDIALAVKAMKAGAADFIEKPYGSERIIEVVFQAMARKQAEAPLSGQALSRVSGLTPREREVLEELVMGRPNKIIAFNLEISPRTVEIHRANLMRKMEADSLSHLVRLALAAGVGADF